MQIKRLLVGFIRFAVSAALGALLFIPPLGCGGGSAPNSAKTSSSPTSSPSGVNGQISTTHNPQVALYSVTSPKDGTAQHLLRPNHSIRTRHRKPAHRGGEGG